MLLLFATAEEDCSQLYEDNGTGVAAVMEGADTGAGLKYYIGRTDTQFFIPQIIEKNGNVLTEDSQLGFTFPLCIYISLSITLSVLA